MKITRTAVLKLLRQHEEGMSLREMMVLAGMDRGSRFRVGEVLDGMVRDGEVVKLKGNRFAVPGAGAVVVGRVSMHRDGYGFVTPEGGGDDIFIPARFLRDTMHGDTVEVSVVPGKGGEKREGRVIAVVRRANAKVVGIFRQAGKVGLVIPDEVRIRQEIVIPARHRGEAREGQAVVAEITVYPSGRRPAEGKIVEVLGAPDDPEVEVRTIIAKYELPDRFSDQALTAARAVASTVGTPDLKGRVDLRNRKTVTIDGETARDFDDAVAVERENNGMIRLWVSIADVSHYVKPDSPLDRDAYQRGTSVYFPDRCIPMLPEELSNGICSLNPAVDRLTLTAEMLFDRNGAMVKASFYPGVIRSAARLTYTIVRKILVDKDEKARAEHDHLDGDLSLMEELALRLMEKRRRRGSIDFDLPEPQLVLDLLGGTLAIVRAERNLAHRIIEEFMLAANEAVASYLEERHIPSLYRIHEPPDILKLKDLREFIFNFGYDFSLNGERVQPGELQKLLDQVAGKPEERMINEVLLRSMKQARYSAENLGHFGLAAQCYTHFTSPIRRYPDLVVHRILKGVITGRLKERDVERLAATLPDAASHCSSRERNAMEAEREIVELKKVQFMLDKVGEEFDGIITGVTSFGIFIELVDLFVEGMAHVSMLPHDFYRYVEQQHSLVGERTRRVYRIGDSIRIRVAAVSVERKQIDFAPASEDIGAADTADGIYTGAANEFLRVPVKGKRPGKKNAVPHREGGGRPAGKKGKGGGRRRR